METKNEKAIKMAKGLEQFYGSENFYRHGINRQLIFSDGAKYVADEGRAYWLLDEIAIANLFDTKVKNQDFQVWKLTRTKTGNSATLTCDDGNDNVVFTKRIPFTDFPLPEIVLWVENHTIYLPNER